MNGQQPLGSFPLEKKISRQISYTNPQESHRVSSVRDTTRCDSRVMNLSVPMKSNRMWHSVLLTLALTLFVAGNWPPSSAGQGRPMPDGPGKAETQKFCSQCHELNQSLSLKQDRAGWRTTVDKMVAAGMKASEAEVNLIVEYLSRN